MKITNADSFQKKRRDGFIERSLRDALKFLKDSVYSDAYASKAGFLQARDPRVKTITIFLFIVLIMMLRDARVVACLYLLCLALAGASKIGPVFFLKRTWVFIPLFSVFIAVPAAFSFVTPGSELLGFRFFALKMSVTREGLSGALLFMARVAASVSFAVLLSLTTRHNDLLKVLRIFRIPQIFVMTLGMCYRYIYLFVEIVEHTYMAVKSRVGGRVHHTKGRDIVAWNIGSLWLRSYQLNNQVYDAMRSRGFNGEPQVLDEFSIGLGDAAWVLFTSLIVGFSLTLAYMN